MLASLPGWFPSHPEGRVSTALNPGRSLGCHRLSLGKMGRSCDHRGPRRKPNTAQMGQGTLKKGLLPEKGSGIRGEFEAPRDRQQREAITTGKVGRGRGRNGCDKHSEGRSWGEGHLDRRYAATTRDAMLKQGTQIPATGPRYLSAHGLCAPDSQPAPLSHISLAT